MIDAISETSCCGMDEFHGFYNERGTWWAGIVDILERHYGDAQLLPAIVLFSGADFQTGKSPFSFAKWLKNQGETVVSTPRVRNSNSGNRIQAFLWTPSAAFRKTLARYYEEKQEQEQEKENNAKSVGAVFTF